VKKPAEVAILNQALGVIARRDPGVIEELTQAEAPTDVFRIIATRLGIGHSTLANWRSLKSRNRLTVDATRDIAAYLLALGADEEARDFVERIVSKPLGWRLDIGNGKVA